MSADIVFVPSHPIIRSNYFLKKLPNARMSPAAHTYAPTQTQAAALTMHARTHARTQCRARTHVSCRTCERILTAVRAHLGLSGVSGARTYTSLHSHHAIACRQVSASTRTHARMKAGGAEHVRALAWTRQTPCQRAPPAAARRKHVGHTRTRMRAFAA